VRYKIGTAAHIYE